MAKSIRISDDLYEMASLEAKLMHRSLAQQIEHWAAIGQAAEAIGEMDDVRNASLSFMRARDHDRVRRRRVAPDDLALISKERLRRSEFVFPKDAFAEYDHR